MSHDVFIKLLESARELRQERIRRLSRLARAVGGVARPRSETGIDVRAIRATTGLSQSKFAELLSIEVSTLRNWEQGRREPPARPAHYCAPFATIQWQSYAHSPTEPGRTHGQDHAHERLRPAGGRAAGFRRHARHHTLVERMHHTIQLVHPPIGASRAESTRD